MPDFLLEIGTEEIPARMLESATQELQARVYDALKSHGLEPATREIGHNATPRRLCVIATNLPSKQQDVEQLVTGPAVKVAFKDGQPTDAAYSFAKKAGIQIDALERVTTPKGEYLSARVRRTGRKASEVLAEILPKEISAISWAKSMYWRAGKAERFVRPVRWIVCLLDEEVVPIEFAGIVASNLSRGHRVLGPHLIAVPAPTLYNQTLQTAHVIASAESRRDRIGRLLSMAISDIPNSRWREDKELLDTVVYLTECPGVALGDFDPTFLSLPEEILVTVMRDHQKYFAVETLDGKLAPHFLAVLNTEGDPDGLIRQGNERVLRARFKDAQFFWETDQKLSLDQRVDLLASVTFHKDLGSYLSKMQRLTRIATQLSAHLPVNREPLLVAARLAKADLTTELVREFTELQGIVGGLYAKNQGHSQIVADAIYDHYRPESSEDPVPRSIEGAVVSIADKADTIAGMFALGLQPSGSKDPFALRRQANGIVRILSEKGLSLTVSGLFAHALHGYKGDPVEARFATREQVRLKDRVESQAGTKFEFSRDIRLPPSGWESATAVEIDDFMKDRIKFYLTEIRKIRYDVVNAVLEAGHDDIPDVVNRCNAVIEMLGSDEFNSILAAFKRIKNILRQAERQGDSANFGFTPIFREQVEADLYQEMQATAEFFRPAVRARQYSAAFRELSKLRNPIDRYFDKVLVMAKEPEVRADRLGFLNMLRENFTGIADLSEIVTEGK